MTERLDPQLNAEVENLLRPHVLAFLKERQVKALSQAGAGAGLEEVNISEELPRATRACRKAWLKALMISADRYDGKLYVRSLDEAMLPLDVVATDLCRCAPEKCSLTVADFVLILRTLRRTEPTPLKLPLAVIIAITSKYLVIL